MKLMIFIWSEELAHRDKWKPTQRTGPMDILEAHLWKQVSTRRACFTAIAAAPSRRPALPPPHAQIASLPPPHPPLYPALNPHTTPSSLTHLALPSGREMEVVEAPAVRADGNVADVLRREDDEGEGQHSDGNNDERALEEGRRETILR